MKKEYKVGNKVVMKKAHPCGNDVFEVTRTGIDIKIRCLKCNHSIMMDRIDFDKRIKKIVEE